MKKKPVILFWLCYAAYASIYIARVNLSMASPALKEAGVLDSAQLGLLGSVFSVVYAIGRILNGAASDRIAPWKMLSIGLTAAGLSNLLVGLFPPYLAILVLWGSNAFAQSMLWSSVLCTVAAIYPPEAAGRKSSIMVTVVAAGNIAGILLNLFLIDRFGLRWAFLIPGGITLVMAALIVGLLREIPAPSAGGSAKHLPLFRLLTDRGVQLAVAPSLLHGVMKDNITFWMTVYFTDQFAIDLGKSAYFVLLVPVVGLVGRMSYPLFYRLCHNNEHRVTRYAFLCCLVPAVLLCVVRTSPLLSMVCLSLLYAAASVANTSLVSIFPLRYQATGNVASVSGIMDFSTYLGAGIASVVYGLLVDRLGYFPMFLSWAVLCAVALLFVQKLLTLSSAEKAA